MAEQQPMSMANMKHLHYCEQVAKGKITTKRGRPLTDLERFDCRKTVNQCAARRKGATTLYFLLYGLLIDDEINGQLHHPELSWMELHARKSFVSTVAADIASGNLIIRDLFHFFQCNDSEEVRRFLNTDDHDHEWLDFSICVVVSYDDARAWLRRHKRKIPGWLNGSNACGVDSLDRTPTGAADKDTHLQALLLGMAVVGFGYKVKGRSGAVGIIKRAIDKDVSRPVSTDLISIRLKEVKDGKPLPSRSDVRTRVLWMVLAMAESHWKYGGSQDQSVFEKISSDLKEKDFFVSADRIEAILIEAGRAE